MIPLNAVNINRHNFQSKEGVGVLIQIVEPLIASQIDDNILTLLVEALKYWSNKALSEEK